MRVSWARRLSPSSPTGSPIFFDGNGTEVFNASVLLLAACMLGWHQIWMSTHGAELAGESRAVGRAVKEGAKPLSALAIICAVAVLREGSETVLFLYGIAVDGETTVSTMLQGGLLGVIAASLVGWLFYAGLLRVPLRHIFRVTGVIIILLAAGLAAQAAAFLVQAGYLPALGYDIWNTSEILPQTNPVGFLLHILVGYVARPEGIQIASYAATVALILAGFGTGAPSTTPQLRSYEAEPKPCISRRVGKSALPDVKTAMSAAG